MDSIHIADCAVSVWNWEEPEIWLCSHSSPLPVQPFPLFVDHVPLFTLNSKIPGIEHKVSWIPYLPNPFLIFSSTLPRAVWSVFHHGVFRFDRCCFIHNPTQQRWGREKGSKSQTDPISWLWYHQLLKRNSHPYLFLYWRQIHHSKQWVRDQSVSLDSCVLSKPLWTYIYSTKSNKKCCCY